MAQTADGTPLVDIAVVHADAPTHVLQFIPTVHLSAIPCTGDKIIIQGLAYEIMDSAWEFKKNGAVVQLRLEVR